MSYMRGDVYIWAGVECVHFWVADGYDGWDESVWAEGQLQSTRARADSRSSGVQLSQDDADAYVMMRLAELVADGSVGVAIDRALAHTGNGGCLALQERAEAIRAALVIGDKPLASELKQSARSASKHRKFTAKQGQYLAFIDAFTKLKGISPAESEIQKYFGVSPPTAHDMIKRLHLARLIERRPGEARSIRVLVPRDELPELEQRIVRE